MNDLNVSIVRIHKFLACDPELRVATSTVAADIAVLGADEILAATDFWRPRLVCARRMLREKQDAEKQAAAGIREAARKRYLARRKDRAAEQSTLAKLGGSGGKKKQ